MSIFQCLQKDIRFYHSLRFPGRKPSFYSLFCLLCSSRGLFLLIVQRISHGNINLHPSNNSEWLTKLFIRIFLRVGVYILCILTKSEFLPRTEIEPGIYLSDYGHIILGARAIGCGTIIHNRVTIGKNNIGDRGLPEIGRNVWIGPHSVIYGNISIGDGVTVLPNTVITRSVPSGVMLQGNPARVVNRFHDNSILRSSLSTDISPVMNNRRVEN